MTNPLNTSLPVTHTLVSKAAGILRDIKRSTKDILGSEHFFGGDYSAGGGEHKEGTFRVLIADTSYPSTFVEGQLCFIKSSSELACCVSESWTPVSIGNFSASVDMDANNNRVVNVGTASLEDDLVSIGSFDINDFKFENSLIDINDSLLADRAFVDSYASSMIVSAYTGGESVTYENGLIHKFGVVMTNGGDGVHTVTFNTAFPTVCLYYAMNFIGVNNSGIMNKYVKHNGVTISPCTGISCYVKGSGGIRGYTWEAIGR